MSRCPECPHCQSLARVELADLILPPRPRGGGRAGLDLPFYKAFGTAYDAAVARFPQPMRKIREANPGLTANQCRVYLKRARAIGVVHTPALTGEQPAAASVASPTPAPAAAVAPVAVQVAEPAPVMDAGSEGDRPEWLRAWSPLLDEDGARWLYEEGTVKVYDYASRFGRSGAHPDVAQDEARQELQMLAEDGVGSLHGDYFTVTMDKPPARTRSGRPPGRPRKA